VSSRLTPVEILSKPRPAYTEEARRLQIEGEALVEVLFAASGEARVVRVMRGLGHGLDEAAVAAARGIRFRPAQREGGSVDSSAVVHIVFQLAY
jgi:TonB family protein